MHDVGYYNGKVGAISEMTVPMCDRAYYFGDGVYDATYAANRKIYKADYHVDRFFNSLSLLRIPFELTKEELRAELQKCLDLLDSDGEAFLYWQASRGTAPRGHAFPTGARPNLMIYAEPEGLTNLRAPMRAITVEDTRFFHCNVKTLNLIPNVLAAQLAAERGCEEAIFHRGSRVTECAHSNVNILSGGVFVTPPLDNLILPGTARRTFLKLCAGLGVPAEERVFTVDELMSADEIMVTNCGCLGASVREIDGKPVGGKDQALLHRLQRAAVDDFADETGFAPDIL